MHNKYENFDITLPEATGTTTTSSLSLPTGTTTTSSLSLPTGTTTTSPTTTIPTTTIPTTTLPTTTIPTTTPYVPKTTIGLIPVDPNSISYIIEKYIKDLTYQNANQIILNDRETMIQSLINSVSKAINPS